MKLRRWEKKLKKKALQNGPNGEEKLAEIAADAYKKVTAQGRSHLELI